MRGAQTTAKSSASAGGIGFFGLLFLVLLVLKLTGWADIAWFWVVLSCVGPLALFSLIFAAFVAIYVALDE